MDVQEVLAATQQWPPAVVYAALFGGALIEYVFPPFPGDTVVVAGAALVGANGWAAGPVWTAVTAGSIVGALFDLLVGRWLARGAIVRLAPRTRTVIDDLVGQFRRYGSVYLALNRFLPGIRALLFVAAGVAGLPTFPVMGWATLSAVVWNSGLVWLGLQVGENLELLTEWVQRYNIVTGVVVVVIVLVIMARIWRRLRG
jgi:membrane protein DedA with SNARE-associated domain